ncbi:YtfJ family protein [Erwinia sp. S38]|uniref:YtfJ family protein n=1 Tax=Erwinia sp. S38 TaxID=2769338 RepID=UPI00190B8163|nr:YtfJ family protein [Erwinia sp. S38]MBK0002977.1 YtfJ family protein [Erwinia sp. S38]
MLRISTLLLFILFPTLAFSHNFIEGQHVAPVGIADRGELVLNGNEISYKKWNSSKLQGKVRVVHYIAGRRSAKKKNSILIKAIKAANFPGDQFQPTTIVNTDDEFLGTGLFVVGKVEKNQRHYPWAQFIIDSDGLGRKVWQLKEDSSTIVVLDREGRVQWAKDGALTPGEVLQVISLIQHLLDTGKPDRHSGAPSSAAVSP